MNTFVAVSFTLKGQDFGRIKQKLQTIAADLKESGDRVVLVHGFMPKHEVLSRGFNTDVVDTLDELFPVQCSFYSNGKPDRIGMADLIHEFGGEVHVIGEVSGGVSEEVALYMGMRVKIFWHELK